MQEMLVRGYLYQMIKRNYNVVAATVVSTILFTFAHGGAFEAGTLPVLNVLTMSLFMTAVLEYTNSLIAPIIVHFLWNSVGAIILGGVSLAEDYPHLFNMTFGGNQLLSGGIYKIEGSVVVFVLNVIMIIGFIMAKKRRILHKKSQTDKHEVVLKCSFYDDSLFSLSPIKGAFHFPYILQNTFLLPLFIG